MAEVCQKIYARLIAGDKPTDIAQRFLVARSTVYRVKSLYEATGDFAKRYGGGRPHTVRTRALIMNVRRKIKRNPCRSIAKMAREAKVSQTTMQRIITKDLKLVSRAVIRTQPLTSCHRQKRVKRCKKMLNFLKSNSGRTIVFSDEKNWNCDKFINRRNTRYLAKTPEDVDPSIRYVAKSKFPPKAMSFGLVGQDGFVFKPIWCNGSFNSKKYIKMLKDEVIPVLDEHYGVGKYTLQQDGASCHTSKATQKFLKKALGSKGFWSKDFWPPNLPNLNPLDYHIWMRCEEKACREGNSSIATLKKSVEKFWAQMSDASLVSAVATFRSRLEKCIAANGGIFEK